MLAGGSMEELLSKLGKELVDNPFLSMMILDENYNIVWHNASFSRDFDLGDNLVGKKCFEVTGSPTIHANCPLQKSLKEHKRIKGFLDFGDVNFLYFTVPLDEKHAAKIHIFLPKEPNNQEEIN